MEKFLKADSSAALPQSPDSAGMKRKRSSSSKPVSAEKGYFELRKEKLQEQAAKPESRPKVWVFLVAAHYHVACSTIRNHYAIGSGVCLIHQRVLL
jgi:hypothetical protein